MRWVRAVILAFSTFTRIPVPRVKWDDGAGGLAFAFIPLAGALVGLAVFGWGDLCLRLELSSALYAAAAVSLPVLITGGIHMDGYCDTADALASWQDKERRLEIMKDPHIGAFALIRFSVYLLLSFGLMSELYLRGWLAGVPLIYTLSRCLAALSALTLPNAREGGMLAFLTGRAERLKAVVILMLFTALSAAGMLLFEPFRSGAAIVLCVPVTLWYRSMTVKRFGGATGDTTGFYLQITELALLAGLLAGGLIWRAFC